MVGRKILLSAIYILFACGSIFTFAFGKYLEKTLKDKFPKNE
jgi:hypothetical protein